MPALQLPRVQTLTEFFAFTGGLDQTTVAVNVPPGRLFACQNYEPDINGGYRRVGGYERFDGRSRPSDASYTPVACTLTTTPATGASLVIGAATCLFVEAITGGMVVTNISGTIPAATAIMDGATNRGTTSTPADYTGSITSTLDATYLADASDVMRTLIQPPAGSGAIRGVVFYAGNLYCFRDNVGATACAMWKSSTSGWTAVALNEQVSFTNANTNVTSGTLTQGGVTATIQKVVVQTGSLASGVNSGYLVISARAGGNYAAGAATSTGAGALTLSGVQTAITFSAGGTFQFDVYNFGGQQTSVKLYGCNGIDKAFEFDGSVVAPISTGATQDKPTYIKGHRTYLFVAQGSSIMNSSVANPLRFVAAEGAAEIAVGDTITGLVLLPGQALGIMARNSSFALVGATPTTWSLQVIRADVGAVARTTVPMSDTYMLDDRGIISITTAQEYGNFNDATLSRRIQPTIDAIRNKVVCAYALRQKNQYVLLCSDGSAVVMGVGGAAGLLGFTTLQFSFVPNVVWSSEDTTGVERVWVGAADGYVYELNRGSSFDGATIEAFVKVFFNHNKSPRDRKRYRLAVLDLVAVGAVSLSFLADFSYGDPDISAHLNTSIAATGGGGVWDILTWDQFTWDAADIEQPRVPIEGTGRNVALIFYSNTRTDQGHLLQGATLHYTPRRLQR